VTLGYGPGEPLDHRPEADLFGSYIRRPVTVEGREEAALLPSVAGRAAGLDPVEERVAVAVDPYLDHPLRVPAGGTLAPQLRAGAGVVVGLAGREGLLDGLAVRVGERQNVAGRRVLGDDGS
jgi:hypothetical protein